MYKRGYYSKRNYISESSFSRWIRVCIRPVNIVNVPDIGSFPFRCNNLFFSKSKFEYASIKGVNASFFNVTYLKKCSIYHTIMREAKLWLNKNREEKVTILVYSLIYPLFESCY